MSGLNAYLWSVLNGLDWWWWGLNSIAATASLSIMAFLAKPQSLLGRILRYASVAGYWLVILSPLLTVGQALAMPILMWCWVGLLYQMYLGCRVEMPRQVEKRAAHRFLRSLVH